MKFALTLFLAAASLLTAEPAAQLWDERAPLLKADEIPVLQDARFTVIKPYEFNKDGYRFLHGVALCFHKGRLYASFGHNKGGENTDTEEGRFCVSDDDGKTWGGVRTIDSGDGPVGVSHGAFLSHGGTLWAFHGAYTGTMQGVHTRAYVLDETTEQWQPKGTVIEGGFWPMQEPQKMEDGNWIMAGLKVGAGDPAIVAISHGEDLTKWDVVPIPQAKELKKMWGESTVIVNGKRVTNIARYGDTAEALVATSEDYGRTWGEMRASNLPMTTSKPIAGTLSTGQRYLVCTTTADSGKRRSPSTIAVSGPGETVFSKVFVIRHAEFPSGPGESNKGAALSYPYAVEHDGKHVFDAACQPGSQLDAICIDVSNEGVAHYRSKTAAVTPSALVKNPYTQKLTRSEFLVPTEIMKRGENQIAIAVNRKGPFPPSTFVKVEKVEMHLK